MLTFNRRVVTINNKKTSIRLSNLEWQALDSLCRQEQISRTKLLCTLAGSIPNYDNLTATIRIFITGYYYVSNKITYDEKILKSISPSLIKDVIMLMR